MHVIGEETSQRLDVIPAQFRVSGSSRTRSFAAPAAKAAVIVLAKERDRLEGSSQFGSGGTDVYLRGDGCAERPALQRRCGARGAYVASSIVDERLRTSLPNRATATDARSSPVTPEHRTRLGP
jgi:hypothetical protein